MRKTYLAVRFTTWCFFGQFVDRKVRESYGLKYYLLAGDTRQGSVFFPDIR